MKKVILLSIFICCSFNLLIAQGWLWGKQGISRHLYYGEISLDHSGAVDGSGDIVYTGYFNDTLNFGSAALNTISAYQDAFTVKYDASGNVLWANRPLLPSSHCLAKGYSTASDAAGNTYETGIFTDTAGFGAAMLSNAYGGSGLYLVKYNQAGSAVWATQSTQLVAHGGASGSSIARDAAGNLYVAGAFTDTVLFGTDTLRSAQTFKNNVVTVKYDANGNELWARPGIAHTMYFGGYSYSIATDKLGGVYCTGYFTDTLIVGPYILSSPGIETMFLIKYDSSGNLKWATQGYCNSSHSRGIGLSLSVDGLNHLYMIGGFVDTMTIGTHSLYSVSGRANVFLARYDTAGNPVWVKTGMPSDNNNWFGYSVMCDTLQQGGGYGLFYGNGAGPFNTVFSNDTISYGAGFNTVLMFFQFDTNGKVKCRSTLEKGNVINGGGVAVDKAGTHIYMTGNFIDTLILGLDTLNAGNSITVPMVARWKTCCAQINTSINTVNATCNLNNGAVMINASGGSGPLTYTWNPVISSGDSARSLSAGTYSVTVSDSLGCSKMIDTTIANHGGIQAGICCNAEIISGSSINLASLPATKYQWVPDVALSCDTCQNIAASPTVTTWYYITVYDSIGCRSEDSVLVTVDKNCGTVFVPEAFSPNGDGQNDRLIVHGNCISTMDFVIYDRWGNKVFESESINNGWDGTYKGKAMNSGNFVYYISGTLYDGTTFKKKGSIALVR